MMRRILSSLALVVVICALRFVASAPGAPPAHNDQPTTTAAALAPEPIHKSRSHRRAPKS